MTTRSYKSTEKGTQDAVCEYLAILQKQNKLFFWRHNVASIYNPKTNSFRAMPKYSLNGISDIVVIKNGEVIFLEIKDVKGKLNDNQKEFERLCKLQKAQYHIIRNIDEVIQLGLQND